jgi:hypothetical protein
MADVVFLDVAVDEGRTIDLLQRLRLLEPGEEANVDAVAEALSAVIRACCELPDPARATLHELREKLSRHD